MKFTIPCLIFLTAVCPLFAADDSKKAADPVTAQVFPPELVLMAQKQIALTPEQLKTYRARLEETKQNSDGAPVPVAVEDLLSSEQLAKLRGIAKDGGAQLAKDIESRLTEKVGRVQEGAQKMAAEGSDPSEIQRTMQEKFQPLMQAGKTFEAEAVLDRTLQALGLEDKDAGTATDTPEVVQQRVAAKIQRVLEGAKKWAESGRDPSAIGKKMEEKVRPLLETGRFAEAEPEVDRVLKLFALDGSPAEVASPEENQLKAPEAAAFLERIATGFRLSEGLVWDGRNLIFSDVFPSEIHKLAPDGSVSRIHSGTRKGAGLAVDSQRRLLICEVDGFCVSRIEKDGKKTILADSYDGKKLNGPNDLAVDARDGIYFTDPLFLNPDKKEQDKEAVYYISPDEKILRVADDLVKPNGIALSRDGRTLFVADTAQSVLRAYSVKEDGTLGAGREFGTVPAPDGVRVDLDGKVYAAGKTGVAVWEASGNFLGTIKTIMRPNSLAFGGADWRMMFISSNASVFKCRLDEALRTLNVEEPAVAQVSTPP